MSHLEALITAMLQFFGVSHTEAGVHIMTPVVTALVVLPLLLVAIAIYLRSEDEELSFKRSVRADISSL